MKVILLLAISLLFSLTAHAQPSDRPTFVASTMDGARIDIEKLKGKVVVLNLWFINCPNCLEEIKLLNELVTESQKDPNVVFLAPAASSKKELTSFLAKNPFRYQVIPDAAVLIISQFGTPDKEGNLSVPFPMHYVIDREGKVVMKEQGIKGVAKVRIELKRLLASRPSANVN